MERTNAPVIAGRAGDRLTKGLQQIIEKYRLPFVAYNQGSICHLETSGVMLLDMKNPIKLLREMKPRKHMIEEMGAAYMAQGLITLAGSRMYTSLADTDDVIDEALNRFEYGLVERGRCKVEIDLPTVIASILSGVPHAFRGTQSKDAKQSPARLEDCFAGALHRTCRETRSSH